MTAPKITGGTITGVTLTGNTFSSPVISGGTINNATIGATTATTGKFTSVTNTGLTSGRVMYATTGGLVTDSANLTFDGTKLSAQGLVSTGALNVSGGGWGVLPHVANSLVVDSVSGATRLFATGIDNTTYGKYVLYTGTTNSSATQVAEINATGIFTMNAYGAGAATFSAAGVISSVSDETWKTKDGVPTNPDVMLQKLEPGYWFYNEEKAPTFGQERQLGFYAQNVHEAIGEEAAPTPEKYTDVDGKDTIVSKPWGYYDRSVLAITVMSLKTALSTIEELKQRITALENK
jgi:hypothetical protein